MKAKEIFQYLLGGIIVIGYFGILVTMIVKGGYGGTLDLVIGSLIAAFGAVVGYYYGSSKGSSDKNDLLKNNMQP